MPGQSTWSRSVLWMLLFNAITRGINFVLSIILARNFLPEDTDIYLFVWNGINVMLMFVSTVNIMVVSPAYIRFKENNEIGKANSINSFFFNCYFIPLLLFSVVSFFTPVWLYSNISGFDDETILSFSGLLRYSGIWMALVLLNNFFGSILLSNRNFVGSLIGQVITAIVTLSFIAVAGKQLDLSVFFKGQIVGNILCFLFYQGLLIRKIKYRIRLFTFSVPFRILREAIASMMSALVTLSANFLFIYFLTQLAIGHLSAYNYGSNLANLPDVLLLSQFVSVIGVRFSSLNAKNDDKALFSAYSGFSYHVFFLMAGISILCSVLSPLFVDILYGKEKLGYDVYSDSVFAMTIISLVLPFKALDVLNNRLLASFQAISIVVRYTIPLKIFNMGLLIVIATWGDFKSLVVFQLIAPVLVVSMQLLVIKKYFYRTQLNKHIYNLIRLFFLSLIVYVLTWLCKVYLLESIPVAGQIVMLVILVLLLLLTIERFFKMTIFYSWIRSRLAFTGKLGKGTPD